MSTQEETLAVWDVDAKPLTRVEAAILSVMIWEKDRPETVTVIELSRRLGIKPVQVARAVTRLMELNYIVSSADL